jgi:ABC-type transport system substrate-binding protein
MLYRWFKSPKKLLFASMLLTLAFIIACGAAATATPAPPAAKAPAAPEAAKPAAPAAPQVAATPVPKAAPAATPVAPARVKPAGTINVGQKELGALMGHPTLSVNPALFVIHTAPIPEGLAYPNTNREIKPWLAESWSISQDFTTWTFKLRKGVQFHRGYGEMTAEDVVWSYVEGWAKNEKHVRFQDFKLFWAAKGGSVGTPDPYTVVVNTGKPLSDAVVLENWMLTPGGSSNWVASKKQSEKEGIEAANVNPALTGPWEIVEHRPQQFWKMRAVENHWRQTPHFAELVFWEVPEESARIAGFQTGQLDTFTMAFDTIPLVEKVKGAKLMGVPGGGVDYGLQFYGNYLLEAAAGNPPAAYDPKLPWVSSNADLNSVEWDKARKVRQALSIAIDRQLISDTVLRGFGRPIAMWFWSNFESQLGGRRWEYNPDKAKQLLAEAGYPKGFKITLTTAIRAAPAEVEACEIIATMWTNIGIDVKFQKIPYDTLRPQIVGRTYQGATCHAAGARVVTVGAIPQLTTKASFNDGATHPFLEEIMPRIEGAIDRKELASLEGKLGAFIFDNALTHLGLYTVDVVWPVGPRLEEWKEHATIKDLRNINGYEFIRPRK